MGLGTTNARDWSLRHWDITLCIWVLVAINALVFDITDRDRDRAASIYTFFNLFDYNKVLTVAVSLSVILSLCASLLHSDTAHLAMAAACMGTALLLYRQQSQRYVTHLFELNIALPLVFLFLMPPFMP